MELDLDSGIFYFTISPMEANPLLRGLYKIYHPSPIGVIMPNVFALVPITVNFKSLRPVSQAHAAKFHHLLSVKLQNLVKISMEKLIKEIKTVVKWTDVITVGQIVYENNVSLLKVEYGEVIRGILEIMVSELILDTMIWETRYGYKVDVKRQDMDIMLLGTCSNEMIINKFKQRVYDADLRVSARSWEVGVSFKRNYIWKHTWESLIKPYIC
jgi:hypothetical protein